MFDQMPILFVSHRSPMNAIEDNEFSRAWIAAGSTLPSSPQDHPVHLEQGQKAALAINPPPNTTSRSFTIWEPGNRASPPASSRKR
jgi:hypothetical protein